MHFMKMLLLYFGGSFLLHLLWENAQAPLFEGYESFSQHFSICFQAAATGDMFFMLVIYLILAVVHRDQKWITRREAFSHPATWVLSSFVGMLFAIIIELRAILEHRWSYTEAMPILPFFPVGLTPVAQMIIVPLMMLLLCRWLLRKAPPSRTVRSCCR